MLYGACPRMLESETAMQPAHDENDFDRIGRTHEDSEPWYPQADASSAPNVVVVLFDDAGFGDFGCYGSELSTPNIDSIAALGHRYINFHTTTLCSPSRACLLTGRNHHSVGMRMLSNVDSGWPSGRGRIPRRAAMIPEVLKEAGYNTFAVGKWHIAPMREVTPAGPFDEWPLGRGFDQFYGFMNGETDHFNPELVRDNHFVEPPGSPADGYHLTDDLIDQAIRYIADHIAHRPANPFFLYLPLGAPHAPQHAPPEYLDATRGCYDSGWEVLRHERYERQLAMGVIPEGTELPPGNPNVPRWDSLSEDEQLLATRLQEAYAAFLEHADAALGRLFDFLKRTARWDNTLLLVTSDNGAGMEGGRLGVLSRIGYFNGLPEDLETVLESIDHIGGPLADNHYAAGWGQVSNTPLRWYKSHTHGGGIRDPLVVSWPGRMDAPGAILDQFHHIIDIAPTIYDTAGVVPLRAYRGVSQMPIHGRSMARTFADANAPQERRTQYFEMFGHRGIWIDGWKAVTYHEQGTVYSDREWELYHLDEDFSESRDLAASEPARLREMVDQWWVEAGRYGVLPLDDRSVELFRAPPVPGSACLRSVFEYFPPVSRIETSASPPFSHATSYRIEALLRAPFEGVIVAYGNVSSGFVLYVLDGTLHYEYNAAGLVTRIEAHVPTESQELAIGFDFQRKESGTSGVGRLIADGDATGWTTFGRVLPFLALSGMEIGANPLSPVSPSYEAPFPYCGSIDLVRVELDLPDANLPQPPDD